MAKVTGKNKSGSASQYTAGSGKVTAALVSPNLKLVPGSPVKLNSHGFKSASRVRVELHSLPVVLGEVISNTDGTVDDVIVIPGDAPSGKHHLVLIGENPQSQVKQVEIPIDLIVPTASMTSTISGKITNAGGTGLPYVVIRASTIDGLATATAQSDSRGNYSIVAPVGMDTLTYEWSEYSETQRYASSFGLPASWRYMVPSLAVLKNQTLNLKLPEAISVSIEIPNPTYSGYVTIDPGCFEDPISSTFDIAEGVSGSLSVGTVSGRYATPGSPATFRYFPISNAYRIFVEGYFFGTRGTNESNHYRTGIENVDLSHDTVLSLNPTFTTLSLNTVEHPAGANYAYIYSPNYGFELNANDLSSIHVPTGIPLTVEYGHQQYSSPSSNTYPDTWRAITTNFIASGPSALNFALPLSTGVHSTFAVNGSSTFAIGTGGTPLVVHQIQDGFIPVSTGTGAQAKLINGGNSNYQRIPGLVTAGSTYSAGSQSVAKTDYFFSNEALVSSIQVKGQGSLDNRTHFFKTVTLDPATVAPGQVIEVNMNVVTEGMVSGQVMSGGAGVGITTVGATSTRDQTQAVGSSQLDGSFQIPAPQNANSITIFGLSNIDSSSRRLPKIWSINVSNPSGLDLGTFTLPTPTNTTIQVLGPLGLPIPHATIYIQGLASTTPTTVISSTGVIGQLYDGICPETAACELENLFLEPQQISTDSNGIATLRRFGNGPLGKIQLILPGSGPNAATNLTVDTTSLIGGTATITVPDRK